MDYSVVPEQKREGIMRLQLFLNDEDYVAYNIAYQFQTKNGKTGVTINRWITPALSLMFILCFWLCGFPLYIIIAECITLTALSVYSVLTTEKRIKKRIRKQVENLKKQGKLPYENEATIDISEEMIMEYTPSTSKRILWSEITQILYDEEHVYLMFSVIQALMIPYRCVGPMKEPLLAYIRQRTGIQF